MAVQDTLGLVGDEIDQIRFDEVVDQGGFGVVYRGHHTGLDETVAVKCMHMRRAYDPELAAQFRERFRDETKIAYRLSRGNLDIVRSITSGTLRAPKTGALVPYTAFEWLQGNSMAAELRIRQERGLPNYTLDEAVQLFDSAVTAIAYAHEQGVVHRDLKPGNLFLAQTRDGLRLKVLDFGIAKAFQEDAILKTEAQTEAGIYLCSPSYGAPEQFDNRYGPVGPWTDVYSLALVFLEILAGKKARPGRNLGEGALKITNRDTAQPRASNLGLRLPARVESVLYRAVSQSTEGRPKDAAVFWGELRDAMLAVASDDGETIANESLPGTKMIREAIAKAKSEGRISQVNDRPSSPRSMPSNDLAAEVQRPLPPPAQPQAPYLSGPPPSPRAPSFGGTLPLGASMSGNMAFQAPAQQQQQQGRPSMSTGPREPLRVRHDNTTVRTKEHLAPPSRPWLWVIGVLVLLLVGISGGAAVAMRFMRPR